MANQADKYKNNGISFEENDMLFYPYGGFHMASNNSELFNQIYKELAEELGMDIALKIYHMYHGTQITFPKRLFNSEYVKKQVVIEYDGTNSKQLAKKYDYSEKSIKRMIRESVDD